jgi:hypothetical protein
VDVHRPRVRVVEHQVREGAPDVHAGHDHAREILLGAATAPHAKLYVLQVAHD